MSRLDEAIMAAERAIREWGFGAPGLGRPAPITRDDLRELIAAATQHRSNIDRAIGEVERARIAVRYLADVDIRVG